MIVIVDYGMGNLRSIQKSFQRLHVDVSISSDRHVISNAKKLILPGVGHFAAGMKQLQEANLLESLQQKVMIEKVPILGICLGMQLFARKSEEGNANGLGWIDAEVIRFRVCDQKRFKVPHIGWNSIEVQKESSLLQHWNQDQLFYFVHSYHMTCNDPVDILSTSVYDVRFVSAVQKGNIFGTQFHPEKSHRNGMQILKNFADMG